MIKKARANNPYKYGNKIDYKVKCGPVFDDFFLSSKWVKKKDNDGHAYVEFIGVYPKKSSFDMGDTVIKTGTIDTEELMFEICLPYLEKSGQFD